MQLEVETRDYSGGVGQHRVQSNVSKTSREFRNVGEQALLCKASKGASEVHCRMTLFAMPS